MQKKIIKALHDFGFDSLALKAEDFMQPNTFVQLGYPPVRIDLITELEGMDFETCYAQRVVINIEDTPIHFIDKESLILNKNVLEDCRIWQM